MWLEHGQRNDLVAAWAVSLCMNSRILAISPLHVNTVCSSLAVLGVVNPNSLNEFKGTVKIVHMLLLKYL